MRGDEQKNKNYKRRTAVFIIVIALLFSALLAVTAIFVRVRDISVSGTRYYDAEAVRRLVFPQDEPRLYEVLKEKYLMKSGVRRLFKSCRLKMPDLRTLSIEIEEQDASAVLKTRDGQYLRLYGDGTVLAVSEVRDEHLPLIDGIPLTEAVLFKKASAEGAFLDDALYYVKLISKTGLPFDTLFYDVQKGFYFKAGTVTVRLGSRENADEKVNLANDQYPELSPLTGTLHLEKYSADEDSGKVYFKVGEK